MVLAIANHQNLVDQAQQEQDLEDATEGMEEAPCGSPSKGEPARYCISEVGHSGRHKYRNTTGLVNQASPGAGGSSRSIGPGAHDPEKLR